MFKLFVAFVMASLGLSHVVMAEGVFETMQENCGKAFKGRVVMGPEDNAWRSAELVMHIRDCSATEIKVPLAFNDDYSRIWVFRRHADGSLSLKHDHRHSDGSEDKITQYGGRSRGDDAAPGDMDIGFPADAETVALFKANGLDGSIDNTWHIARVGDDFIYRLTNTRGRDFRVGFDLTKPVAPPPPAWDMVE